MPQRSGAGWVPTDAEEARAERGVERRIAAAERLADERDEREDVVVREYRRRQRDDDDRP